MQTIDSNAFVTRAAAALGQGWRYRLADITGKNYATVKRWCNGELAVPGYALTIVELLEALPGERRPLRFRADLK